MREAMARAEVGDEQWFEDPTVDGARAAGGGARRPRGRGLPARRRRWRTRSPSRSSVRRGYRAHSRGDEPTSWSPRGAVRPRTPGLQSAAAPGSRGRLSQEQIRAAALRRAELPPPKTSVIALENTHNRSGGTGGRRGSSRRSSRSRASSGGGAHLDGARVFNAALAPRACRVSRDHSRVRHGPGSASRRASAARSARSRGSERADGCAPRLEKHGSVARCGRRESSRRPGLYALDHNVERLADDHARARRLAEGWDSRGVPVDVDGVETNFVLIDVEALALSRRDAVERSGRGPG